MEINNYLDIDFNDIKWPNESLPKKVRKNVKANFLLDRNGNLFGYKEMKSILTSWLHDEFNECPLDFDFDICF